MKTTAMAVLMIFLGTAALSAAPFRLDTIPQDAKWAARVDVERLKETRLGRMLLDELNREKPAAQLAAVEAVFRFDPRKDLSSILVYGSGASPEQGVALIRGTFDEDHLATLVQANETYEKYRYGSHVVHSWIDEKPGSERLFGCFHPSGALLLSQGRETLKTALDVLDGKKPGLSAEDPFARLIGDGSPVFFLAAADLADLDSLDPDAAILKKAAAARIAVGETGDDLEGTLRLTTRTLESARQVQKVLEGMLAFARLNDVEEPDLARLADRTRVSRDEKTVEVVVRHPVDDLIRLLREEIERKGKEEQPL